MFASCAVSVSDVTSGQKRDAFSRIGTKIGGKKKVMDQSGNHMKM